MSIKLIDPATGKFKRVLLIDDVRDFHGALAVARSVSMGIHLLENFTWDILLLDHDMGEIKPEVIHGREATGYDVLRWLEEHPGDLPGEIILVTSNGPGRKRMEQVIAKLYPTGVV
jgi:CheY-like chemotaxis protein